MPPKLMSDSLDCAEQAAPQRPLGIEAVDPSDFDPEPELIRIRQFSILYRTETALGRISS